MFASGNFTPTVAPTPIGGATPVPGTGPDAPFSSVSTPASRAKVKLPKNANRIIFIRGLPQKVSAEELYDIFGKYGSVRQIRKGVALKTKCTAFVVYDDVYDAKNAVDHLNGFNVAGRYLSVCYYDPAKEARREAQRLRDEENQLIREKSGFA